MNKSEKARARRNVRRAHDLRLLLQANAPKCPERVASAIAVDLADLVEVAAEHQQHVRQLLSLKSTRRKSRLGTLLAQIDVNLLFHANYHIESLRKNLPKFAKYR